MRIGEQEVSAAEVQAMLDDGCLAFKNDTSSAMPSATPTHGPLPGNNAQFGIFSEPSGAPKKTRKHPFWNTILPA